MNKKITSIIIACALLLMVLGGLYVYSKNQPALEPEKGMMGETQQEMMEGQDENSFSGTFKDLLGLNKSLQCTYNYNENGVESKGTSYVSGNRMRGDYQTNVNGVQMSGHMISDGTYFYMWSDENKEGTKLKIDQASESATSDNKVNSQNNPEALAEQKYNYDCSDWSADSSKFELPSGVQFTDMDEMMNQMMGTQKPTVAVTPSESQNPCSACDALTDSTQKDACKQALSCK